MHGNLISEKLKASQTWSETFYILLPNTIRKINISPAVGVSVELKIARKSLCAEDVSQRRRKIEIFQIYTQLTFNATYRTIKSSGKALIRLRFWLESSKKPKSPQLQGREIGSKLIALQTQHKFTQSPKKCLFTGPHRRTQITPVAPNQKELRPNQTVELK